MQSNLAYPLFIMLLLPFLVLVKLFLTRATEMKLKKIHPQTVATRSQMSQYNIAIGASENFLNLFEMPIIFYALTLFFIFSQIQSTPIVILAWIYVISRYFHSYIQSTYNKVMHRFYAFAISAMTLFLYLVLGFLNL